jgi:hypothetical protein
VKLSSATVALTTALLLSMHPAIARAELAPPNRDNYLRVQLRDGRVLFAGGSDNDGKPIPRATIFDPAANKFTPAGAMLTPRCGPVATSLADGTVLIAGGATCSDEPAPIKSLEILDPKTATFHAAGELTVPRFDLSATLLQNGKVLIAQGYDSAHTAVARTELYNPATGAVEYGGSMMTPRCFASQTKLANGMVLFAGGIRCDDPEHAAITAVEIYDPAGQFARVGEMNVARVCQSATLMKDGKVLIAGGATGFGYAAALDSAEIYVPEKATFSPTGNMTKPRACASGTARDDGTVLIKGGHSQTTPGTPPVDLTDSEIYDPATGKFTAASLAQ